MHAPIPAAFSVFFLPLSFFFSVLFLLLISNYYLVVGCFSHLGLFPFGSPSLGAYYSLTMGFFPLDASTPLGPLLSVIFSLLLFFSLPLFFPLPFGSLFLLWLPSFCSELIQWDFSLLPLGFYQLFLVCCRHPFKITHTPIGCPCHCSVHVCCTVTHFMTKFLFVCSCCVPLPHYLALWHA